MAGNLILKWGTVKGWGDLDGFAKAKMQQFADLGMNVSALSQEMTPAHVEALCDVIDAVDEPIQNDWSGEGMTRDEAKAYVRDYAERRRKTA